MYKNVDFNCNGRKKSRQVIKHLLNMYLHLCTQVLWWLILDLGLRPLSSITTTKPLCITVDTIQ